LDGNEFAMNFDEGAPTSLADSVRLQVNLGHWIQASNKNKTVLKQLCFKTVLLYYSA
jgi:hypothetical protein